MAGTRSSSRLNSSPQSEKSTSGTKRKADDASPSTKAKRGRPSKDQMTLEETVSGANEQDEVEDTEVTDAPADAEQTTAEHDDKLVEENVANGGEADEPTEDQPNAFEQVKADAGEAGTTTKGDDKKDQNGDHTAATEVKADAVEEDKEREKAMPSNILEKGVIYFFVRGRVGVQDPDSVQDLARSYFVLRPLPDGAKITKGAIQDVGNNRLIALPKKVWPKSGKDRFMVFVDKAKTSMEALREEFFHGSEYTTQTTGTRQTPDVTPIGEGVYAITSTGGGQGTSHLAYMLTIPKELGEVQKDVGLAAKGSFALSVKNPESSAPAGAALNTAEYPKEFIEEFRGRGWMPAEPKHLDYSNASVLIIGEDFDNSGNLDPSAKDQKDEQKETPQEELEKLEKEDEIRVDALRGDDTIFADLGITSKDYPDVMTTW